MNKFFSTLFAVIFLFLFSTISFAQTNQTATHRPAVKRGVVETAPKRKPAIQKRIISTPTQKPVAKNTVRKTAAPHTAKSKTVAKGKQGKSWFWKIVLNRFAMMIWIPLLLTAIAIIVQIYRLFPRRKVKKGRAKKEEKIAEGETTTRYQRLWKRVKDFLRRLKKKPVLAAG